MAVQSPREAMQARHSDTPAKQNEARIRRKHHKVWTGCGNCKRRHLKCDEAKPDCARCLKAKLPCNGYNPPKAKLFEMPKRPHLLAGGIDGPRSEQQAVQRPLSSISHMMTPNLGNVWRKALLDAFLTTWLPDSLIRDSNRPHEVVPMVPMSAWPSVAWKLAQKKEDGLVAHSLLCLTLAVLGVRTADTRLTMEASRNYGHVLHQFQRQVSTLAQRGNSADHDDEIASLVASGFCCSQVEYMLRSWLSGDQHLQGIESLLQGCGPSFLEQEDNRKICYDHCLLWTSCSVTHRRPTNGLQWLWQDTEYLETSPAHVMARKVVALSEQLASLLQAYDGAHHSGVATTMLELRHRFTGIIADIEAFYQSLSTKETAVMRRQDSGSYGTSTFELHPHVLTTTIIKAYASALQLHAVATTWRILRSYGAHSELYGSTSYLTEERLHALCEYHTQETRRCIVELSDDRFGMVTVSPLLHSINAAWVAYETLAKYCGFELSHVKDWFIQASTHVVSRGYRPLREPWCLL